MSTQSLCYVGFIVIQVVCLGEPSKLSADEKQKQPKNETVMSPGMRIEATTTAGTIAITAIDELTRAYTWEGATRSVEMGRRAKRWYGSLGLYYPGPGDHWKAHKGITRCVVEEGQQHFESTEEALKWIESRRYIPLTYRDDGLVVGWGKTLPRRQLNVEVWQILIKGKKPTGLAGSQNNKIAVTSVQVWTSPLGQAVQKGDTKAVKDLLAAGADPKAKNIVERSVLFEAAMRGDHEIVQALLEKGADPNEDRDDDGLTALLQATYRGHIETVKALLAGGADPNGKIERGLLQGGTPLMAAVHKDGHAEIVKALLAKGADVNAKDALGETVLSSAQKADREDMVKLLKAAGAKE